MKLSLLTILALLPGVILAQSSSTGPTTSTAPEQRSQEGQPDQAKRLAYLTARLNLTPDQQNQVKAILDAESAKMKSIYEDASLSPEQKHQQMDALHQDTYKQIQAVLTPEQLAQLQQRPSSKPPEAQADGPFNLEAELAQITAELKLSPSRQDEVRAILTTLYDKTKAVHADANLSDQQKSAQIEALYQEANKQIREILTPEQVTAFYRMKRSYYGYYR